METKYYNKYLKYKSKYLSLLNGGFVSPTSQTAVPLSSSTVSISNPTNPSNPRYFINYVINENHLLNPTTFGSDVTNIINQMKTLGKDTIALYVVGPANKGSDPLAQSDISNPYVAHLSKLINDQIKYNNIIAPTNFAIIGVGNPEFANIHNKYTNPNLTNIFLVYIKTSFVPDLNIGSDLPIYGFFSYPPDLYKYMITTNNHYYIQTRSDYEKGSYTSSIQRVNEFINLYQNNQIYTKYDAIFVCSKLTLAIDKYDRYIRDQLVNELNQLTKTTTSNSVDLADTTNSASNIRILPVILFDDPNKANYKNPFILFTESDPAFNMSWFDYQTKIYDVSEYFNFSVGNAQKIDYTNTVQPKDEYYFPMLIFSRRTYTWWINSYANTKDFPQITDFRGYQIIKRSTPYDNVPV